MLKQSAMPTAEWHLYALTVAVAVVAWLLPWLLLDGLEAWDHWTYFIVSVPAMSLVAGYAGFRESSRWWRWPVVLVLAQLIAMLSLGGFGNLLPLGIIVFLVLAVPMAIAAAAGAWIARRRRQHAALHARRRAEER